jgi:hypothetical protein
VLGESHRQKLIPARERLLLILAVTPVHTFLEIVPRQMVHELGENRFGQYSPLILRNPSALSAVANFGPNLVRETPKSKNSQIAAKPMTLNWLCVLQK